MFTPGHITAVIPKEGVAKTLDCLQTFFSLLQHRVFDQNERHNVYLEELTWTNGFANLILVTYKSKYAQEKVLEFFKCLIEHPDYKGPMATLCDRNIVLFKEILQRKPRASLANGYYNPKVEHFVRMVE